MRQYRLYEPCINDAYEKKTEISLKSEKTTENFERQLSKTEKHFHLNRGLFYGMCLLTPAHKSLQSELRFLPESPVASRNGVGLNVAIHASPTSRNSAFFYFLSFWFIQLHSFFTSSPNINDVWHDQ